MLFPLPRLAIVLTLSVLFAWAFASVVRYSGGTDRFDAQCRVSSNPACFGPYRR